MSNTNVSSLNVPKIKPFSSFYACFNTSNFDDDSIKNEQASKHTEETSLSRYKYMGYFFQSLKGTLLHSKWLNLAKIRTHPGFYACLESDQ